jgi:membrane fusion protein (multidrug efflux system)
MVPTRAVSELQGIFRVFVVGDDNVIEIRTVQLGPEVDNLRIIEEGLEAGERVAIEGLLRLRNGAVVNPTVVDLASLEPSAAKKEEG